MDQGLLYGWGLFETLRIYGGKPFMIREHMERMISSAKRLGVYVSFEVEELTLHIDEFIETAHIFNDVLRITLTKEGMLLLTHRPVVYAKESYRRWFAAKVSSIKRNPTSPLTFMKTLNYMDNILAKQEAVEAACQEALLFNDKGYICEGSMSNVFWIKEGCLHTPSVECGLLPGIARQLVIDRLAPLLCIGVREGEYAVEDKAIGGGVPGSITAAIMEAYDNQVAGV
ncbi:MAG: branched-chain amino acid aminotransferase [Clostridiales bacterium]|nr:branched-chain amino acid aminotransferase [Clostridiales bacterium]